MNFLIEKHVSSYVPLPPPPVTCSICSKTVNRTASDGELGGSLGTGYHFSGACMSVHSLPLSLRHHLSELLGGQKESHMVRDAVINLASFPDHFCFPF